MWWSMKREEADDFQVWVCNEGHAHLRFVDDDGSPLLEMVIPPHRLGELIGRLIGAYYELRGDLGDSDEERRAH